MPKRVWASAAIGVAALLYFHLGRGYPLELAALMGAALMMFSWASVRTWEQLRRGRRR